MSSGMRAGLEIRETERVALPSYRTGPNPTWFAVVPSVDIDQVENRTLFALLAGYPSSLGVEPLLPLRGLPEDVTRAIRDLYDEWNGLAFDASWVTLDDLVMAVERLTAAIEDSARAQGRVADELLRVQRGVSIDAASAFLSVYHARGFDTRMVFWFTPV